MLLLASQFLFCLFSKLLMALNNLHEDKFCSDETQVKQFICLHTDSLIDSQVSKPYCPTKVIRVLYKEIGTIAKGTIQIIFYSYSS